MKRQYIIMTLLVVAALAVAFYQMKLSPNSKTTATQADIPVTTSAEVVEDKQNTAVTPREEIATVQSADSGAGPVEDATPTTNDQTKQETPEQVATKIKQNLSGARQIFQQKAAIEKAKPEDVHHMPKQTLDAAKRLGEIAELEAQHPEQAASFREFYLECARDENTITVTRAQCLDRYLKGSQLDAAAQKQFLTEFPEEVVRLVEALQ